MDHLPAESVVDAFEMAVRKRKPARGCPPLRQRLAILVTSLLASAARVRHPDLDGSGTTTSLRGVLRLAQDGALTLGALADEASGAVPDFRIVEGW